MDDYMHGDGIKWCQGSAMYNDTPIIMNGQKRRHEDCSKCLDVTLGIYSN
jgi:hypothetical protein